MSKKSKLKLLLVPAIMIIATFKTLIDCLKHTLA